MAQPPRPNLDTLSVLDDHGSRRYVYPADAKGKWSRIKPWVYVALIGIYLTLPFIEVAGRPAVLIDIAQRRFFFFGLTFNAQDFWLAFFVLTGIGFLLIVVAALWGRVWCGWACPQTVFLDGLFRRIERWIEGPAEARRRLAAAPMDPEKFVRKGLKHLVYLALSFSIAHLFIAYFVGADQLGEMIVDGPADHMTTFLPALVMSAVIYGNFYWFREQLCIVICPYGRLQSVLHDRDTVNVNYDHRRGEPRGKAKKVDFPIVDARVGPSDKMPGDQSQGDCVDCGRCIAVCPTGIDIRNGHQLECIGCAYCIDACDDVMAKLHRPKGLIRYDSLRGIETGKRRFWRPRVFFYAFMGALGLTVASLVIMANDDFEANLLRAKATPFVIEEDVVRNSATLHVINKTADPATFKVNAAAGSEGFIELAETKVEVEGFGGRDVPIVVRVPRDQYRAEMELFVEVRASYSEQTKRVKVKVLGPRHLVNPGATP